jgi:hypothetical protein
VGGGEQRGLGRAVPCAGQQSARHGAAGGGHDDARRWQDYGAAGTLNP